MGKLEDAKQAAADAAQRRATAVGTSPPDQTEEAPRREVIRPPRRMAIEHGPETFAAQPPGTAGKVKIGRPPRGEVASEVVIAVRVTAAENGELVYLANQAEMPLSVWARDVLLASARVKP